MRLAWPQPHRTAPVCSGARHWRVHRVADMLRVPGRYGARLRAPKCCIVQEYIPGGSLEARIYGR